MPRIALADTFLDALERLDPSDAKRAAAFLQKLALAPSAASLRPEIVHDAADRSVRSFKVTHDLRAIARIEGEQILLLHVARHDRAYVWARGHCVNCHPVTGELLVVRTMDSTEDACADTEQARRTASDTGRPIVTQLCSGTGDLCRILSARGIEHELDPGE